MKVSMRKIWPLLAICLFMLCSGTTVRADVIRKAEKNSETLAKGKLITDRNGKIRYRYKKTKEYAAGIWLEIDTGHHSSDKQGHAKTGCAEYHT